jgi:hypothetical protein
LNQPIFSNIDYYKNKTFQRLMREWNTYLEADIESDELAAEWEEQILKDFLDGARFWLKTMRDGDWLEGQGLE